MPVAAMRSSPLALVMLMISVGAGLTEAAAVSPVVSFGVVTDVHYADAPAAGTRVYRDSLTKMHDAVAAFNTARVDFVVSLGDLKDTDATKGCAKPDVPPPPGCVNLTVGFLKDIDEALGGFNGPRHHILGNHDVDILAQPEVIGAVVEAPPPPPPLGSVGGPGYSSWSLPAGNATDARPDTFGCLVKEAKSKNVWVVHKDGTRNWLSSPPPPEQAAVVADISVFPKRHGGVGLYALNVTQSAAAVAQRCAPGHCICDPATGTANATTLPTPAKNVSAPLRFVRLNADYTDDDLAWADLDNAKGPGAVPGMSWEKANVPSFQLTWLAAELDTAEALGQHVVVFVHYRVDGGPNGPVGKGLGPPSVPSRAWVDDCTLQNAEVVRDVLERKPGLVLAVFSGHDHAPQPPYTKETATSPLYFTHHAMVENALPHNAYSIVSVLSDCSIVVRGFVDAYNATIAGPPGANCSA